MEKSYYVEIGSMDFILTTFKNIVTDAPHIMDWMIGKNIDDVNKWLEENRGNIREVKNISDKID